MRRSRRGVQALEFALAAPLLLMLGSGIIDYSWFYANQHSMVVVSQEAVRAGMNAALDEDPAALAQERALESLEESGLSHLDVEVVSQLTGTQPDLMLEVSLEAEFNSLVGVIPVPTLLRNRLVTRLTYQ